MPFDDLQRLFETHLFTRPSTERLFNPYRDRRNAVDRPDAPAIRQANLRRYLAAYPAPPPLLLLAEAPGPWGCRFSGVPLVSEAQLLDPAFPLTGDASSTRETPHTEYSAGIYWRVLQPYFPHFFTWNSVPFHPHYDGKPLTIRTPTRREVRAWTDLLADVLALLQPQCLLAVGRTAEYALEQAGASGTYVRHPSQGGARRFEAGVLDALRALGLA